MPTILLLIALLAAGHIETGEACGQKMDLCFYFDDSSTVCDGYETCENWRSALQFSRNITTTLDIGSGPTFDRVAFVTYGNTTEVQWNLTRYTAMNPLLSAIDGVPFKGGVFDDIASANLVVTQVYSPAAGDDTDLGLLLLPARKNVLVFMTDGNPKINETTAEIASLGVQQAKVTFFVICITSGGCTESWAKGVASKPDKDGVKTVFMLDSYSSLYTIWEEVLEQICYFLENPPTPTPTPLVQINLNLTIG